VNLAQLFAVVGFPSRCCREHYGHHQQSARRDNAKQLQFTFSRHDFSSRLNWDVKTECTRREMLWVDCGVEVTQALIFVGSTTATTRIVPACRVVYNQLATTLEYKS